MTFQAPLFQVDPPEYTTLKLGQFCPVEAMVSEEPGPGLIASVSEYWVPTVVVCPDPRYSKRNKKIYYPIDGKRRIKAVLYLLEQGYEFMGMKMNEVPIPVALYKDLTPDDEHAFRMAFLANNQRSANAITDTEAVKSAADVLKVDIFSKEGRSAVAKYLHTSPQVVGRMAKALLVDDIVLQAYSENRIAKETFDLILGMTDKKSQTDVYKRLIAGESLTAADIKLYNKASRETAAAEINAPTLEFDTSLNPLGDAIVLLEGVLEAPNIIDTRQIERALGLLRELYGN